MREKFAAAKGKASDWGAAAKGKASDWGTKAKESTSNWRERAKVKAVQWRDQAKAKAQQQMDQHMVITGFEVGQDLVENPNVPQNVKERIGTHKETIDKYTKFVLYTSVGVMLFGAFLSVLSVFNIISPITHITATGPDGTKEKISFPGFAVFLAAIVRLLYSLVIVLQGFAGWYASRHGVTQESWRKFMTAAAILAFTFFALYLVRFFVLGPIYRDSLQSWIEMKNADG